MSRQTSGICRRSRRKHILLTSGIFRSCIAFTTLSLVMMGCATRKTTTCDLDYCDGITGISDFRNRTADIAWPCLECPTTEAVSVSHEPRNLRRRNDDVPREISLAEIMRIALTHNEIIETSALGGVGAKAVLANPVTVASVYDPAIQSSGVLFGRRSVETALADFDTTFTTSLIWQRNDMLPGGSFAGGGNRADFRSALGKQFANGDSITLRNDWAYSTDIPNWAPDPGNPTGGAINYFGSIGAEYRHPLLAGSGVEYTRIAGPANPNLGPITGVSQGVVIARINQDISIANFESAVRNAMRDIENAYWDLYLAYRVYDTAVVAHQSSFQTWREAQDRLEVGVLKPADELQARDQLYETKAAVETNLNGIYRAESELRRLVGLPMNDGEVLVPVDEPIIAELRPDWKACLSQGLSNRVELRQQKWNVKSLQLQLQAARSLVRPRLDFVAGYDVQGAGNNLLSDNSTTRSAIGALNNEDINSWNVGLEMSIPIGFRFSRSQVRNLELQVTKATAVLASQEKNIAHDIALSIQDIAAAYSAGQSNYKRLKAAASRVELLEAEREIGTTTLDLVLRAQRSLAAAESAFYSNIVDYNKAITGLDLATGALLENNGISLAEGPWVPDAHCDALLRAQARTHAKNAPRLSTQPADFASPGPVGSVDLLTPDVQSVNPHEITPIPEQPNPPEPPAVEGERNPDEAAVPPGTLPNGVSPPDDIDATLQLPMPKPLFGRRIRSAFLKDDFPEFGNF